MGYSTGQKPSEASIGSRPTPSPGTSTAHSSISKTNNTRRLLNEEWEERQRRGLYFRCGERWSHDHKCTMKNFQIIILGEEEENEMEEEATPQGEGPGGMEEKTDLKLSSYNYWGLTSHKTFKVLGEIQGDSVMVLIDPGASANFLPTEVV